MSLERLSTRIRNICTHPISPGYSIPFAFWLLFANLGLYASAKWDLHGIQPGTAAQFWERACGIELPGFTGFPSYSSGGEIYPPVGKRYFYNVRQHHFAHLYMVTEAELAEAFEQMVPLLTRKITSTKDPALHFEGRLFPPTALQAKNHLRQDCLTILDTSNELFTAASFVSRLIGGDETPNPYYQATKKNITERWTRWENRWQTIAFEFIFLNGWILFLHWPFLYGGTRSQKAWRVGTAPLLYCVPFYLGFSPLAISLSPSGAYFYPALLLLFSLPMIWISPTPIEISAIDALPKVLEPLNQLSGPISAISFSEFPGPIGLCLLGGFLAVGYVAFSRLAGS